MTLLEFVDTHPILTVVLLIVVFGGVIDIIRAFK